MMLMICLQVKESISERHEAVVKLIEEKCAKKVPEKGVLAEVSGGNIQESDAPSTSR